MTTPNTNGKIWIITAILALFGGAESDAQVVAQKDTTRTEQVQQGRKINIVIKLPDNTKKK